MAFLDSLFNMGDIFRQVNSVMFMLISLGLLVRTTMKRKEKKLENYEQKIHTLEQEVSVLKRRQREPAEY
jgi:hypothetical protein